MDYSTLRRQPTAKLEDVNSAVEKLLSYQDVLPAELRIKLDTFHADIAAIMEDREDAS